jgi:flagellin-specific chaperone FliS
MTTTQTYQLTRHEALLAIEGLRTILDTETNAQLRVDLTNLIDYMEGIAE